jgi:hypothetical protein
MQSWVESDARGRQYLVRTGTGVVTAVVPLGIIGPADETALSRVEIYCDAPHGRPGSIRYSAHAVVPSGHPLLREAQEALNEVWPVIWTIEWHRHDWIPDDLPITSLTLSSDALSVLTGLDRVRLPDLVDQDAPEFVPATWLESRP